MIITDEKISLFFSLFRGITTAYGTFDPDTGRHWQVKETVTKRTIYNHLIGIQPYGFYPIEGYITRVGVVDFDDHDPEPPLTFIRRAEHFDISAYLEKSKSKGYHAWMFFQKDGAPAKKVRTIINYILEDIGQPNIEIFPKQDHLQGKHSYGNFINTPLFGKLIPEKTVFLKPDENLKPYRDQWEVLESIRRNNLELINEIIETNTLEDHQYLKNNTSEQKISGYALPICIRRILQEGVTFHQRIACFRTAIHLKRVGLPPDSIITILNNWRTKNRPTNNKRIITKKEIEEQVKWALKNDYTGYGCEETIIAAHCAKNCPVNYRNKIQQLNNKEN